MLVQRTTEPVEVVVDRIPNATQIVMRIGGPCPSSAGARTSMVLVAIPGWRAELLPIGIAYISNTSSPSLVCFTC